MAESFENRKVKKIKRSLLEQKIDGSFIRKINSRVSKFFVLQGNFLEKVFRT